jgi:hypothetical protein
MRAWGIFMRMKYQSGVIWGPLMSAYMATAENGKPVSRKHLQEKGLRHL